jgi:predicted dehydrogenase
MTAISRRTFVAGAARTGVALSVAPMILPRHLLGGVGHRAPSAPLNVACVGVGGMGMENMIQLLAAGENMVAVCDVDYDYVDRSLARRLQPPEGRTEPDPDVVRFQEAYGRTARYRDFREMLAKQKDIDAVVVATPDHTHAVIALAAMRAGKHVYVQKPLTWSVYESRLLARTARETGLVTQMGNQGHSKEGTRRIRELIAANVIGPVHEVHVWTDRPLGYWAQGIPRPGSGTPTAPSGQSPSQPAPRIRGWNMRTVDNAILQAMAESSQTPPPSLDWDLFLGPAKEIPYHPVYHPFSWRGWVDFGVSALGDMGAHLIDQPYWALDLGLPSSVVATSTPWGGTPESRGSYPLAMTARYEFPARSRTRPAVTLHWYDGGLMPMLSADIPYPGGNGGGGIFVGEKGFITYETYGDNPKVYPEAAAARAARVPKTVPRIEVTHEANWAQACKGEAKASAPFDYSARLTEVMLLGIVALRTGQGRKILYDGPNMRVTNVPEANQYLTREYRAGWEL